MALLPQLLGIAGGRNGNATDRLMASSFQWRFGPVAAKLMAAAKCCFLALTVFLTNPLAFASFRDAADIGQIAVLAGLWILSAAALIAVVVEGNGLARIFWGFAIAASGAFAWGYSSVGQRELDVYGIMLMWDARNFTGNAAANHGGQVRLAVVFGLLTWLVLSLPVLRANHASRFTRWARRMLPLAPIMLIVALVWRGPGSFPGGLPTQFAQSSMAVAIVLKKLLYAKPLRREPAMALGGKSAVRKIVVLVDESIRPDYLDPGGVTGATPEFAEVARRMVDFGPAVSGSNCSSYSNAILRFTAARRDLGHGINSSARLFAYAKLAGYRTVYIDAQAHALQGSDGLQNFMTKEELRDIDGFYPLANASPDTADHRLADIVARELKTDGKVFIYANKQGAHFPYDINYPADEAVFHPTVTERGEKTYESNIASYRNAIRWNVDRFFGRLFAMADFSETFLVYTSDHGQSLDPLGLAHCAASQPHPRMGLVPLYAYSDDPVTMQRLRHGARRSQGRASHFQIVPSLLARMGYAETGIAAHYGESLTAGPAGDPAFAVGDIFGLFSRSAILMPVDLNRSYAEIPAGPAGHGPTASIAPR